MSNKPPFLKYHPKVHVMTVRNQSFHDFNLMINDLTINEDPKPHRGGVAQWVERLTRDRWIPVSREFEPHQRPPSLSLSKKLYSNCLVLVGSKNGFERDLHKQTLLVYNQTK